jgi:signal transduction histidine kinase
VNPVAAPQGQPSPFDESVEELYDHAPCGYVTSDADGVIARLNHTLLGWIGSAADELIGSRRFQDLLSIPGRMYFETHLRPLLRMQGYVSEVALELECRDRPPLPVLVSAVEKRDAAGEPILVRFMIFNAVERRRYERELLLARRRAEQSDRAKAELLAMIGHDMRSPLGVIVNAVTLLERQDPQHQAKYLKMLRSSAGTLLGLANQILDFSRIEAGQAVVARAPFDPAALTREAVEALVARAEEKGIALVHRVEPSAPPSMIGDATKTQQILSNLIGNAVKFTSRGSVTVAVRAADRMLEFSVADTGIGIPPDRLDAIFEEFTQADPEIGRNYGGTGLGLTICRRLTEMLGGKLQVQSELEKGSTFRLTLPLEPR